jgi:hypothetical protein
MAPGGGYGSSSAKIRRRLLIHVDTIAIGTAACAARSYRSMISTIAGRGGWGRHGLPPLHQEPSAVLWLCHPFRPFLPSFHGICVW